MRIVTPPSAEHISSNCPADEDSVTESRTPPHTSQQNSPPQAQTTTSTGQTAQDPPTQQTPPPPTSPPVSSSNSPPDNPPTSTEDTQKPEIVLLIDSNGKYVQEGTLFPKHKLAKLWCPNTRHALELLSEDRLGSPSRIIIHTGTNDLRAQQERVTTALKAVIEKASSTFPNAQVVISTLLPQNYFHPATIQQVNPGILRDCASKPNIYIYLAHHSTLDLNSLYDQVHLYKAAIPTFARTLKDVTLNHRPSTSHRSNRATDPPPRPARHPPEGPFLREPMPRGPTPRPQHHQPHPNQLRPPQTNRGQTLIGPPHIRPMPLLPTPCPPPLWKGPHHDSRTYAHAVTRVTGPTPMITPAQAPSCDLRGVSTQATCTTP
uniref:uncharacterized protein LOC124010649 n=1 Tax=Oncorhynchus gorbuscha TaxID=8017 RepID=UPI001EAF4D1A|nr:uncharacterized protein LOC124010649 [Oncorhynchus gorbuscha]